MHQNEKVETSLDEMRMRDIFLETFFGAGKVAMCCRMKELEAAPGGVCSSRKYGKSSALVPGNHTRR